MNLNERFALSVLIFKSKLSVLRSWSTIRYLYPFLRSFHALSHQNPLNFSFWAKQKLEKEVFVGFLFSSLTRSCHCRWREYLCRERCGVHIDLDIEGGHGEAAVTVKYEVHAVEGPSSMLKGAGRSSARCSVAIQCLYSCLPSASRFSTFCTPYSRRWRRLSCKGIKIQVTWWKTSPTALLSPGWWLLQFQYSERRLRRFQPRQVLV